MYGIIQKADKLYVVFKMNRTTGSVIFPKIKRIDYKPVTSIKGVQTERRHFRFAKMYFPLFSSLDQTVECVHFYHLNSVKLVSSVFPGPPGRMTLADPHARTLLIYLSSPSPAGLNVPRIPRRFLLVSSKSFLFNQLFIAGPSPPTHPSVILEVRSNVNKLEYQPSGFPVQF